MNRHNDVAVQRPELWLDETSTSKIEMILKSYSVLSPHDRVIGAHRAGAGNMNLTLRIETTQGNFIFKQSRPWVQKYPMIAAPVERVFAEIAFYKAVRSSPKIAENMPRLVTAIPDHFALVLEDVGESQDFCFIYNFSDQIDALEQDLQILGQWLARLHHVPISVEQRSNFQNFNLRQLNHEHIFEIPYQNDLPFSLNAITPGLEEFAVDLRLRMKEDSRFNLERRRLAALYLSEGSCLIHGDFYPGSWLRSNGSIKIIDPEFSYLGNPEFDLAIVIAHLNLSDFSMQNCARLREIFLQAYQQEATHNHSKIAIDLVEQWSAIEVIRRLIGVAQLPLNLSLENRTTLLEHAVAAVAQ